MSRPNADRSFLSSSVDSPTVPRGMLLPAKVRSGFSIRPNIWGLTIGLVGLSWGFAIPSLAQPAAPRGGNPLILSSDSDPQPVIPDASGGLISIESDTQSADNVTGVITAAGNVRILYPARGMEAKARQAQYFSREGRLILSGDVDVKQNNGNALRAERVIYLLDQERAEADPTPGQQVFSQLVIRSSDRNAPTALTP